MKKLYLFLLAVLCSVGLAYAGTYTITLKDNGTSSDGTSKLASNGSAIAVENYSVSANNFVSSIKAGNAYVFPAQSGCGWKFGNSSNAGKININFANTIKVSSIVVTAKKAASKDANIVIDGTSQVMTSAFAEYTKTYNTPADKETLTIETSFVTNGDRRGYVTTIVINTYEGGSDPTPANPYTVTFSAGDNGTCSTSSLTETSAGAGVTLPSCDANDGYKFLGWTATEGKTTVDDGLVASANFKPSDNIPLYAVYAALYQVTIEEPTNGFLSVKFGGNDVTSGDYYAKGEIINIVATPADGYKFRNLQVVDASTHTYTASNAKDWTMGDHAITIKANFDAIPVYTVAWSVNGSVVKSDKLQENAAVSAPEVANVEDKVFTGWVTTSSVDPVEEPAYVTPETATDNITYYAVFATQESEGGEGEIITLDYQNVHSAYTTDGVDRNMQEIDGFKYYGCMQGKESGASVASILQMRKTSNNVTTSWIYNSTEIKFSKIVITYTSTNNKLCNVFFGSEANPTANAVTCDGEANAAGTNTFTNTSRAKFFRIENAKNGAMYISNIKIHTVGDPTYTDYCTTVALTGSVNFVATDGVTKYATFSSDRAVEFGDDVTVYTATITGSAITLNTVGNRVPANTGVLLSSNNDTEEYEFIASAESLGDNNLRAASVAKETDGSYKFYMLAYASSAKDNLGFYWGADQGAAFTSREGSAYLAVPVSTEGGELAPVRFVFNNTDQATGVENVVSNDVIKFFENGVLYILRDGVRYNAIGQKIQ